MARALLLLSALCWLFSSLCAAQRGKPEVCPWCKHDPETMRKAGIVSHGPFAFANSTTDKVTAALPASQWIAIETAHLRWISSLPAANVDLEEQERVQAELARLRAVLPGVPVKLKKLDPWLRVHLMAMKGEEFYARFQKLLAVSDADFPAQRAADKPFMGKGRFLGETEKYEVALHASLATHQLFTRDFSGAQVSGALRWHFKEACNMHVSVPCVDADLKQDRFLFPFIAHNLSHLFFSGYKHFSYDPPLWLDEGLALAMEKEIEPRSTTREGEEGTYSDFKGPSDWREAVAKLLARGKHKSASELLRVREVGELDLDGLLTVWSMTRFLIDERPAEFAALLGGVKGQLDERGYPSGTDLPELQRRLLKELFGWSPAELDEAWKAWASALTKPVKK